MFSVQINESFVSGESTFCSLLFIMFLGVPHLIFFIYLYKSYWTQDLWVTSPMPRPLDHGYRRLFFYITCLSLINLKNFRVFSLYHRSISKKCVLLLKKIFQINFCLFLQERELSFGMRVLPCNDEPGVEIFGHAPQFSPKNFSHVFSHEDQYDIPGKKFTSKEVWNLRLFAISCSGFLGLCRYLLRVLYFKIIP